MKTVIIVQARMSSKRLQGKTLRLLCGKPMIRHVIDRLRRVKKVDEIILATSTDLTDDLVAAYAKENNINCFRGDLKNVQKRFYDAAKSVNADLIIRVTGDNPFISPELINDMLDVWQKEQPDYIGYAKCIYGIGAELFTMQSFERVIEESESEYDFEHVTPPYYQKKDKFKTKALIAPEEFCSDILRLTVDTEEDFKFAENIYFRYAENEYVDVRVVVRAADLPPLQDA